METTCCFVGHERIMDHVCELLGRARKSIYISSPQMDFTSPFFTHVLSDVCKNGVKVNILIQEDGIENASTTGALPSLPGGCFVRVVKNFGPKIKHELLPWTATIAEILEKNKLAVAEADYVLNMMEKGIYRYNQSYIVVDSSVLIFGMGGVTSFVPPTKGAGGTKGAEGHFVVSIGKCDERFATYVKANWMASGRPDRSGREDSATTTSAALTAMKGFAVSGSTELELICRWIDESDSYCYIETSLFLSHKDTKNKVVEHLVKRLIRAYQNDESDNFCCVVLTNLEHTTATPLESATYIAKKINYTTKFIEAELKRASITPKLLRNRIFIGCLGGAVPAPHPPAGNIPLAVDPPELRSWSPAYTKHEHDRSSSSSSSTFPYHETKRSSSSPHYETKHVPVGAEQELPPSWCPHPIKGMCFIQDGKRCLLSSSSICDRSLTSQDSELGIILGNVEQIESLEQLLWHEHLFDSKQHEHISFTKFFEGCASEQGNVRRHAWWKDEEMFESYKNYDFILQKLFGAVYYT